MMFYSDAYYCGLARSPEDVLRAVELLRKLKVVEEAAGGVPLPDPEQVLSDNIRDSNAYVFIAYSNGTPVGVMVACFDIPYHAVLIQSTYVEPEARSSAVLLKLVRAVLRVGAHLGCERVLASVLQGNTVFRKMLARRGFPVVAQVFGLSGPGVVRHEQLKQCDAVGKPGYEVCGADGAGNGDGPRKRSDLPSASADGLIGFGGPGVTFAGGCQPEYIGGGWAGP